MALETWNGRTASQTDADSPLDTTLMDGLRKDFDHLRQVLYGSTDPSFHTPIWGHNHDGTNSKLVVLASQTVGDYLLIENAPVRVVPAGGTYVKSKETKVDVSGTFRIKFDIGRNGGSGTLYGKIYRNGVAVGTERVTGSDTFATFSEDIGGWSVGDLVQVYTHATGGGGTLESVKNFNIYSVAPPIGGGLYNY